MLKFLIISVLFLSTRGEESHFSHPAQRIMATGCPSSSDFQYPDGSCFSTCPDPYINETVSGSAFCYSPCPDKFWDLDKNTCLDSCHPSFASDYFGIRYCYASSICPILDPFQSQSRLCTPVCSHAFAVHDVGNGTVECLNPCPGEYLDVLSQRCVGSCDVKYVRAEEDILFCDTGASSGSAALCPRVFDFKYQNGSCLKICPDTYNWEITDEGYYLCQPLCEQGQYLDYLKKFCIDSCKPQYTRLEGNVLYCDLVAACPSVHEYKYANGSCLDSCPEPGIILSYENGRYFCEVPCPKGQYQNEQYKCVDSCDGEIKMRGEIEYCWGGSNLSSTNESFSATVEIYLRYDISLADFKSQNYLAKFLALISTFLDDIDNSEIKIIDIREGSTIIESEIILKSGSQGEMKSKTQALNKKLTNAAKSDGLNLEGIKVLNSRFSGALSEKTDDDGSSSAKKIAIGVGVGVGSIAVVLGAYLIHRYKKKQRLMKVRKVGASSQVEAQIRNEEIGPQAQALQVSIPDVIGPKAEPFKLAQVEMDLEKNQNQLSEKEKRVDTEKIEEVKEEEIFDGKPPQHVGNGQQENEDPKSINKILDQIDDVEEKN